MELSNARKNYNSFDIAKFICSVLVVMLHISPFGKSPSIDFFAEMNFVLKQGVCRIAVPLFFIFNGYFMYEKFLLQNSDLKIIKKYFLRILNLYLIWTLIYFPMKLSNILNGQDGFIQSLGSYLKKVIFVGSHTHLWYLTSLLWTVALILFLLKRKWSPFKMLCAASVFYIFGLLGDAYYGLISPLFEVNYIGPALKLYFNIFETTRNALFFAFLFISLGMVLAEKKTTISKKNSLIGLVVSLILLYGEVYAIRKFGLAIDCNVLVFTVPSSLFVLLYLKNIELKDKSIYVDMRKISSLIFYGHPMVIKFVSIGLDKLGIEIQDTPLPFLTVLTVTVVVSVIIIKLSGKKHFGWLRKIY